jgi:hypothetical protein
MDLDGIVMKISIAVIVGVLAYFIWQWWEGNRSEKFEMPQPPEPKVTDPVPQGPGIIMYGTDSCPWCTKQKDYFKSKEIEYTFVPCDTPGSCPNFVMGFPTIVKDGTVLSGYQEL